MIKLTKYYVYQITELGVLYSRASMYNWSKNIKDAKIFGSKGAATQRINNIRDFDKKCVCKSKGFEYEIPEAGIDFYESDS